MNLGFVRFLLSCAVVVASTASAVAAVPASRPYASPEIHADLTVTFRIFAPKAAEVTLEGGWMAPNTTVPLVRDEKGLWAVTVGPLKPTVYSYWFNLDGAVVLDQANQYVRIRGVKSSVSNVDIPAATPLPWSIRDVPHGTVAQQWLKSTIFKDTRLAWVYTPPSYDSAAQTKYPILYLFHGAGELYLSWVESGKADLIFDNLIADGKMKPMVVVMPYVGPAENAIPRQGPPPASAAGPSRAVAPGATPPGATATALATFQSGQTQGVEYIVKEIMPWAEAHYRVLPGRKNRAVAGLSAGGALAGSLAFTHLDQFSELGMFSSPGQLIGRYEDVTKNPADLNAKLDLFWVGVGRSDPGIEPALVKFDADLTAAGVHHTFLETDGAHDYAVWRWCLTQFAPLLFKAGS